MIKPTEVVFYLSSRQFVRQFHENILLHPSFCIATKHQWYRIFIEFRLNLHHHPICLITEWHRRANSCLDASLNTRDIFDRKLIPKLNERHTIRFSGSFDMIRLNYLLSFDVCVCVRNPSDFTLKIKPN